MSLPNFAICPTRALIAVVFLMTVCDSRGADLRQQVVGTWTQGSHTLTLTPDGTYTSVFPGKPPVTYTARWHIENGFMLVTNVKSNSVPIAGNTTVKILLADKHHLEMGLGTNVISMRR